MKKILSILLVFIMIFALCACDEAASTAVTKSETTPAVSETTSVPENANSNAEPTAVPVSADSYDGQCNLIFQNLATMLLTSDGDVYCTVTDLDHNGRLEFISAATVGTGMHTTAKIFEVNETYDGLKEVTQNLQSGASMPEIIMNATDTYNNAGTYSYVFKDVTRDGMDKNYTVNCSLTLKNGTLSVEYLGQEATVVINGITAVEYYDANGNIIGPDEYNALGKVSGTASSTNFDWIKTSEASSASKLYSCYQIFAGDVQPAVVVESSAQTTPTPSIVIVTPGFLCITKNPTNESHYVGETAIFVAKADNWDTCAWTFTSPNGSSYNATSFCSMYPYVGVSGAYDGTLYVSNLVEALNGWSCFCTFYSSNGQTARTNTVYMYVSEKPTPVYSQCDGYYNAAGSDNYATAIYIPITGQTVYVSTSMVNFVNTPYDGCSCTVFYTGNTPTGNSDGSIYSVTVYGGYTPAPDPSPSVAYGSLGTQETMSTIPIYVGNGVYYVSLDIITPTGSDLYEGRSCTVYYYDSLDNIVSVVLN